MKFPRPVRAVIFDMDGLLVDTEAPVRDALMSAAADVGRELPLAVFMSMVGTTSAHSDQVLVEHFGIDFDLQSYLAEVRRLLELSFDIGVPLKPGAAELLALLDEVGLPKALVTSSTRRGCWPRTAAGGLHVDGRDDQRPQRPSAGRAFRRRLRPAVLPG